MTFPTPARTADGGGLAAPRRPLGWREAVNAFPPPFVFLLGSVGAFGVAAGVLALPLFFWTTPLVVALLVVGGVEAVRRSPPAGGDVTAPARGVAPSLDLPRDVRPLVAETFQRLAAGGAASGLLEDVVRLASSLYSASSAGGADGRRFRLALPWHRPAADDGGVGELVAAACDCALALDRADVALALLRDDATAVGGGGGGGDALDPLAGRRRAAEEHCERARDALTQRLHETVIALGAACAQDADRAAAGDAAHLSELARGLARDAELRRAASEEVEALLAEGPRA